MSTYDLFDTVSKTAAPERGIIDRLFSAIRRMIRRFEEHRTLVKLSRLDQRLIRDMGFDPAAIYGALEGSWDEVHGDRFRGFD
jgi:uncharacterized protein YjiS (DUF1127 family)